MNQTTTNRWMIAAPDALCWEQWREEEESVLFDRRSNQTHLLTALAAECLLQLREADMDLEQLSGALGLLFESPPDQLREQIYQLLLTFNEIGLITPLSA